MATLVDKRPKIELTEDDFGKLQLDIHRTLEDQELDILKFLCLDESVGLKFGVLETCKNGLAIFDKLEKRMLLSNKNLDLLIELMDLIRRPDLKCKIEGKCENLQERKSIISPYRRMVLELTDVVSSDELDELKKSTLKKKLPYKKMTDIHHPIQMMYALEQQGIIGPEKMEYLYTIFEHLNRKIFADVVLKYQQEVLIGRYRMDSKPRGVCIIINNVTFSGKQVLEERKGSEKDKEKLENTFGNLLEFTVRVKSNLTAKQMSTVIEEVAEEYDEHDYDCFVCCILSHGNAGIVTGVDGEPCEIKDITRHVSSAKCPKLANKPRMFIIQACRGTERDKKVDINISSTSFDSDPREESEEFIPEDADFLIAYASSPGRMAKLNMASGSVYINKLTEVLDKHHKDLDILSMLTLVNKEMCNVDSTDPQTGVVYGQVPAPQFTLTKKLYFP